MLFDNMGSYKFDGILLVSENGSFGTGLIVNETGNSAGDFRWESDTNSTAVVFDATGAGEVEIKCPVSIGDGGTTNYTEIKSDGEINLHGTARVLRHIRVAAPSWSSGVTAPSSGFVGVLPVLCFDKTTDDSVHYSILCPYRIATGSTIDFGVDWTYEGTQDNGTVCWAIEYINLTTGETVAGTTTTRTETTAGTHTTGTMIRTIFTTGITGAVAHDVIGIRLYRDTSADTLDTDACLIQTHFEFIMDKLGEAT